MMRNNAGLRAVHAVIAKIPSRRARSTTEMYTVYKNFKWQNLLVDICNIVNLWRLFSSSAQLHPIF